MKKLVKRGKEDFKFDQVTHLSSFVLILQLLDQICNSPYYQLHNSYIMVVQRIQYWINYLSSKG